MIDYEGLIESIKAANLNTNIQLKIENYFKLRGPNCPKGEHMLADFLRNNDYDWDQQCNHLIIWSKINRVEHLKSLILHIKEI